MAIAVDLIEEHFDLHYEKSLRRNQKKSRKRQQAKKQLIDIYEIEPRTDNQGLVFEAFDDGHNLLLHGVAGTGKTFVSLYLALDDVFNGEDMKRSVTIVRSVVPTRDMGFLPGKEQEKTAVYEQPYDAMCKELTGRGDGYQILKQRGVINFTTTSYIRGTTLDNTIVIVDECQNMTFHELDSIITRVGENTRIIFCGDFRQTDLTKPYDQSGIKEFMKILENMHYFSTVEFDYDDIVRSGLVKEYIMAKDDFQSRRTA
jgi:phosphate starvation-inducible protein PhoH